MKRSAQTVRPPHENLTSAQPAVETTGVMKEVVVDPRLLTKPGDCPSERGTLWRLWRSKMEGWTYGISVQLSLYGPAQSTCGTTKRMVFLIFS